MKGSTAGAVVLALLAGTAHADTVDKLPPLTIAARETFDGFAVPAGRDQGSALLNKIQVSATLRGERFAMAGWTLHGQMTTPKSLRVTIWSRLPELRPRSIRN